MRGNTLALLPTPKAVWKKWLTLRYLHRHHHRHHHCHHHCHRGCHSHWHDHYADDENPYVQVLKPTSILAQHEEAEQRITVGEALRLGCVFNSDER